MRSSCNHSRSFVSATYLHRQSWRQAKATAPNYVFLQKAPPGRPGGVFGSPVQSPFDLRLRDQMRA